MREREKRNPPPSTDYEVGFGDGYSDGKSHHEWQEGFRAAWEEFAQGLTRDTSAARATQEDAT